MLDVEILKPGQLIRYTQPKICLGRTAVQSLWILLEEEGRYGPTHRTFKMYQMYDSENCIDLGDSTVSYTFDPRNAKDFTLEVA